jgi:hypothetical protein
MIALLHVLRIFILPIPRESFLFRCVRRGIRTSQSARELRIGTQRYSAKCVDLEASGCLFEVREKWGGCYVVLLLGVVECGGASSGNRKTLARSDGGMPQIPKV